MINLLAQAEQTFWGIPRTPGDNTYILYIVATIIVTSLVVLALLRIPTFARRYVTWGITLAAGLFWILEWALPKAKGETGETVTPFLFGWNYNDAVPAISGLSQIFQGLLLSLGVVSIFRFHLRRFFRFDRDWFFSMILIASLLTMVFYGLMNWYQTKAAGTDAAALEAVESGKIRMGLDFLFDMILQNLEAAMFSMIGFFILSAAFRAFRIRSVEATILMLTALIVLLSFIPMSLAITNGLDATTFAGNFRIDSIGNWLLVTINTPALRAIDLGLGLGVLAMALRIILGLERGVAVD